MRWRRANWARRAFHRSERRRIELPATRIAREKSYSDAYRWRTRSRSQEDGRQGIVSNRTEVRLDRTDRKVSGKAVALSTDSRAHEQEVAITAFGPNRMFMDGGRCLDAHCAMAGRRVVVMPDRDVRDCPRIAMRYRMPMSTGRRGMDERKRLRKQGPDEENAHGEQRGKRAVSRAFERGHLTKPVQWHVEADRCPPTRAASDCRAQC